MAGDGTSFTIDIPVAADGVEPAAAAAARLATELTGAQSAAVKAAAAVKESEAAYRAQEVTADRAAKALEKINIAAEAQRTKMQKAMEAGDPRAFWRAATAAENLAQRQAEAAAKADSARAALETEAVELDRVRGLAEAASVAEEQLAAASRAAAAAAREQAAAAKEQASALAKTADMVRKINEMTAKGVVSQMAREVKAAQDAADAKAAAAAKTAEMIRKVNDSMTKAFVAQSAKQVEASKKAAAAAKGTGKMTDALDGVAKLSGPLNGTVMQVKEAAEGFGKLKAALGAAGPYIAIAAALVAISIGFAAITAAAVGGVAKITMWAVTLSDKQGLIAKETKRLEKGFKSLFSGLKIDKLVGNFSRIVDLFDETNASGRAIKVVFNSLFQPIVDGIADFLPKMRTAFIQFQIMALKALIAIKPYGSVIRAVVVALGIMGAVLTGVILVAVGVVAVSLGALAFAIAFVTTVVVALVAAAGWLMIKLFELGGAIWDGVVNAFSAAVEWLRALDLGQMGSDIIAGLARGITNAGGAVLSAITGVVGGAVDAAKNLLGIASPSKVFAEIGEFTGEGMSIGVEKSTGDVQGSLEALVAPPEPASSAPAATATPSGGSFAGATFQIYLTGGDTAQANADAFEALLTRLGAQGGTAVPVG